MAAKKLQKNRLARIYTPEINRQRSDSVIMLRKPKKIYSMQDNQMMKMVCMYSQTVTEVMENGATKRERINSLSFVNMNCKHNL